jgi:hypothetical protein
MPLELPLQSRGRIDGVEPADSVLLEAGMTPLAVLRHGPPRVVETSLDFSAKEIANEDALPLLVGLLVDVAMDEELLARFVAGGHGVLASKIGPLETLQARAGTAPPVEARESTVLLPLLLLAIALLMWDAGALGRRLVRETARQIRSAQ